MERQMCRLLRKVLVLLALNSVLAQNENSYSEVGSTLVLTPPFSGRINNILWKHGDNLAAEWLNGELDLYGIFLGRTTLDTATGRLEVKNINESYAGLYTVEINNKVQNRGYNVEVIKRVSKPELVVKPLSCTTASEDCILSCDGDTSGAGPVTYSWKKDDGEWVQEGKDKTIMNNEETKRIKTFSCQVKNPVNEEESDPHHNPFFKEEPPSPVVGVVVGVLVFLALVVGVGIGYWKRESILKLLPGGDNVTPPAPENGKPQNSSPGEEHPLKDAPQEP